MITPRAKLLFLAILFMALTVVLAIFGLVIAIIFAPLPGIGAFGLDRDSARGWHRALDLSAGWEHPDPIHHRAGGNVSCDVGGRLPATD